MGITAVCVREDHSQCPDSQEDSFSCNCPCHLVIQPKAAAALSDRQSSMRANFNILYGIKDVVDTDQMDGFNYNRAYDHYMDLVNQGRRSTKMMRTPDNPKTLDSKMQIRYALLHVLTTGTFINVRDLQGLLLAMGVDRSRSSIGAGLRRLHKTSAVAWQKAPKKHGGFCKAWRLTAQGAQLPTTPPPKKGRTRRSKGNGGTQQSSKGSSARTTNMCIDPSKPTLNKAIEDVVGELVIAKKTFSAYDVTKELRDKVAKTTVVVDHAESGVVHVGGVPVARVDHDYVRDAVHELFHTGKMDGYDRAHTGSHWQYEEAKANTVLPDPSASPAGTGTPPAADGSSYDGSPTL